MVRVILMILCTYTGCGLVSAGAILQLNGTSLFASQNPGVIDETTLIPLGLILSAAATALGLALWLGGFMMKLKMRDERRGDDLKKHIAEYKGDHRRCVELIEQQHADAIELRDRTVVLEQSIKTLFKWKDSIVKDNKT